MTPRDPATTLSPLLARRYAALRRALVARHALRAAGAACVAIAAAVALGAAVPTGVAGAWARLAATVLLCAAALTLALARFRRALPSFDAWLERIEQRFPAVRSWLRNALDFESRPAEHTSPELAQALSRETARRLAAVPLESLAPPVQPRRPLLAMAAAAAVIVLLALVAPARVTRSWATLWDPALAAPPVRLEVEPGSVTVSPGAALAVRARVWGTARRPHLLRDGAARLEGTPEGDSGDGARLWRFDLTQLTREQDYRVRVAAAESPRFHIALAGTPQPVSFEVELTPPAYARLPVQRGTATRGDLAALRGSRARLEVVFDRDLDLLEARLPGGAAARWTAVSPRRWRGAMAVEREGEWELHARAASGEGRFRYRVQPLPDLPPVIAVREPEGDLDLPAGQQVGYEVLGQDDLGLSELTLQFRKDPAEPWTSVPLERFAGEPREARVARRWDASALGLLPGQSASLRFQLFDDNAVSGRGVATSPTFELRFPSLADLYQALDRRQGAVQEALQKVADQAQELQKSLDKLARQPQPPSPSSPQSFERREEMKSALERQQDLARRIDEASRDLRESLQQGAERRAFDEQLQRKLEEMARLMDQIQSKEFREALKKLQQALESMDRRALEQNLPEWRRQNQDLLQNLQRTVDLLKELRREEQLQSLAQRAQELKAQQDVLNQQMESPRSRVPKARDAEREALAGQQQKAAEESEKLAEDAKQAAAEAQQQEQQQELNEAAEELEQEAAPAQRDASQAAAQNQAQRARRSGAKASASLQRAAERLGQMASQVQRDREEVDLAAVRRAAQDLVSLQRASEANLGSNAPPAERSDRQTDLSEGTARVADSLFTLARRTPFVSRELAQALGQAIRGLSNSGKELSQGDRARGEASGRAGSRALNQAILELRQSESAMCQSPGMGQQGSTTPMRMGQLGERQGQLNQQTRNLAQRLSQQLRLSTGDRNELQRLAQEQQRIREQLEQIQEDEEQRQKLLGRLDRAQQEMKEVEEALREGDAGGDVEEKQERILSRMLDAQRSVNRRDFDPQRESRPGEDAARRSPAELPADLLRESDRLRLDLLKAQADRYPAQYRAFIEAYLRSLNEARP